tara:strand:- start:312 stop:539 length:228 start_codon:yes stop_codon:yes gene_type:complete
MTEENMIIEMIGKLTDTLSTVVETSKTIGEVQQKLMDEILQLKKRVFVLELEKENLRENEVIILNEEEADNVDYK